MSVIVIADDDNLVRRLVFAAVRPLGHTVLEAQDGETAWHLISTHRADLVILDLRMPVRNGWEVLTAIKRDPALQGTRAIILSAETPEPTPDPDRPVPDAYVMKPFSPVALKSLITDLLDAKPTP